MHTAAVDLRKTIGRVKPLHGVNNGPVTCNFWYDATELFSAAQIPFCRLHDTEYPFGSGEFVDVACIFKDFSADVEDPASYNFALTDDYLRCIRQAGAGIVYRLGASIEHQPIKRYILPPADFDKWAEICVHIVRHYNEGWANGFYWDISYWEIWNEPDLELKPPRTWTGTQAQFFEFYRTVATRLKAEFPQLKVGGPALAHADGPYADAFLRFVAESEPPVPLDFFSYHAYIDAPEQAAKQAQCAADALSRHGLTGTELIYDEWNYVPSWQRMEETYCGFRSVKAAALCAATLCTLQSTSVDKAMYYDGQLRLEDPWWCGLFAPKLVHHHSAGNQVTPLPPYYAFRAFGMLYRLGTATEVRLEGSGLYGCAATDGKESALLLARFGGEAEETIEIDWRGAKGACEVFLLDEEHTFVPTTSSEPIQQITLKSNSFCCIVLRHGPV